MNSYKKYQIEQTNKYFDFLSKYSTYVEFNELNRLYNEIGLKLDYKMINHKYFNTLNPSIGAWLSIQVEPFDIINNQKDIPNELTSAFNINSYFYKNMGGGPDLK